MSADTLGLVIAVGLPLLVIVGAIFWPERTQHEYDQPPAP